MAAHVGDPAGASRSRRSAAPSLAAKALTLNPADEGKKSLTRSTRRESACATWAGGFFFVCGGLCFRVHSCQGRWDGVWADGLFFMWDCEASGTLGLWGRGESVERASERRLPQTSSM